MGIPLPLPPHLRHLSLESNRLSWFCCQIGRNLIHWQQNSREVSSMDRTVYTTARLVKWALLGVSG